MRIPLVPALAVIALLFAVYHLSHSQTPPKQAEPLVTPAQSPFSAKVAGAGIVESRSENIEIAADVAGVVKRVHVKWGDKGAAAAVAGVARCPGHSGGNGNSQSRAE